MNKSKHPEVASVNIRTEPNAPSDDAFAECVRFSNAHMENSMWHIVSGDAGRKVGVFNYETGLRYPPADELGSFLKSAPFFYVVDESLGNYGLLSMPSGLLWTSPDQGRFTTSEGNKRVSEYRINGWQGWKLPTKAILKQFYTAKGNPCLRGEKLQLLGVSLWLTDSEVCNLDEDRQGSFAQGVVNALDKNRQGSIAQQSSTGWIYACHDRWANADPEYILNDLVNSSRHLTLADRSKSFVPDSTWEDLDDFGLMQALNDADLQLNSMDGKIRLTPEPLVALTDLDYKPCRLPRLETAQLTDPNKGLWELWGNQDTKIKDYGLVARDPALDVCSHNVAIDFGTSSTVVALVDEHGGRRLLRIGVRDFYQPPCAADFENPTFIEIIDYLEFFAAWTAQTYRPALDWDWLHAAHEAQASFRDNPGDTEVLASILARLKQWALRSTTQTQRLTDRQGHEIELPTLSERNPVRGELMTVGADYSFDPIEVYAWFLGMAINWRGRGLYQKYHLTFPVKYERQVKDKILSSFRRGLQRSLPPSLVTQSGALQTFSVTEIASEPTAYAAAALPYLGLEPGKDGVFYAVFDFGGGTTDFDFGLWRWGNDQEVEEGYDQVFEHLHSSGDNYLGGENLLDHLVYACFRNNLPVCRELRIHFTRPLDGERFTGDEAFVHATQTAQTNAVLLAAKLRVFLESDDGHLDAQLKIDLLDRDGCKHACELSLDRAALDQLLFSRMESGVRSFVTELATIREELPDTQPIQVLLAGNGSRSRHIYALFDPEGPHWPRLLKECFGDESPPELIIHAPLSIDEQDHHAPTAKTGVALGLLRLCPGEGVKLVDHVRGACNDEAPFRYFVGKLGRREEFTPVLDPRSHYKQWHLLGPLPQGVFKLCFSVSLRSRSGMRQGDAELHVQRLDFPGATPQDKLFARVVGPGKIELAFATDEATLSSNPDLIRRPHDLDAAVS